MVSFGPQDTDRSSFKKSLKTTKLFTVMEERVQAADVKTVNYELSFFLSFIYLYSTFIHNLELTKVLYKAK